MYLPLWIIYVVIVMIVPESVKREWKSQPTTVEQMKEDLQTELEIIKLKLLNTEARLKMVEQTMTSILSKLNV
jgi:hypothetical protein